MYLEVKIGWESFVPYNPIHAPCVAICVGVLVTLGGGVFVGGFVGTFVGTIVGEFLAKIPLLVRRTRSKVLGL